MNPSAFPLKLSRLVFLALDLLKLCLLLRIFLYLQLPLPLLLPLSLGFSPLFLRLPLLLLVGLLQLVSLVLPFLSSLLHLEHLLRPLRYLLRGAFL